MKKTKYFPGLCLGDRGVPCADYRNRTENDIEGFGNVCGYETLDCDDDSCRNQYGDEWEACANEDVLYFAAGSC